MNRHNDDGHGQGLVSRQACCKYNICTKDLSYRVSPKLCIIPAMWGGSFGEHPVLNDIYFYTLIPWQADIRSSDHLDHFLGVRVF